MSVLWLVLKLLCLGVLAVGLAALTEVEMECLLRGLGETVAAEGLSWRARVEITLEEEAS